MWRSAFLSSGSDHQLVAMGMSVSELLEVSTTVGVIEWGADSSWVPSSDWYSGVVASWNPSPEVVVWFEGPELSCRDALRARRTGSSGGVVRFWGSERYRHVLGAASEAMVRVIHQICPCPVGSSASSPGVWGGGHRPPGKWGWAHLRPNWES